MSAPLPEVEQLTDERLADLQQYHRLEAQHHEREARRHWRIANAALDEIGRRSDARKVKA